MFGLYRQHFLLKIPKKKPNPFKQLISGISLNSRGNLEWAQWTISKSNKFLFRSKNRKEFYIVLKGDWNWVELDLGCASANALFCLVDVLRL